MPVDFVLNKVQAIESSGASMTPEQMETMYEAYGLSGGILEGYFKWLFQLMQFDLGTSFKFGIPVTQKILACMPASFMVAVIATIFI
jgi:peptide/nickel transport system permease protein